jgi:hypothetical protein
MQDQKRTARNKSENYTNTKNNRKLKLYINISKSKMGTNTFNTLSEKSLSFVSNQNCAYPEKSQKKMKNELQTSLTFDQ